MYFKYSRNYKVKLQNKITKLLTVLDIHNIVQEAVTKTIPKEKKCKKAKWLSEKALQIAEKRSKRQRRKGKVYLTECSSSEEQREINL